MTPIYNEKAWSPENLKETLKICQKHILLPWLSLIFTPKGFNYWSAYFSVSRGEKLNYKVVAMEEFQTSYNGFVNFLGYDFW